MEPAERLERLLRALDILIERNHDGPIIVEGLRDEAALRRLGIEGEILVHNRGGSTVDLADRLRGRRSVILLYDWDRKGGHLARLLRSQLGGSVKVDEAIRRELAIVSLVRCVEDLPAAIATLRSRAREGGARGDFTGMGSS